MRSSPKFWRQLQNCIKDICNIILENLNVTDIRFGNVKYDKIFNRLILFSFKNETTVFALYKAMICFFFGFFFITMLI